jgi:hypothetical protein
MFFLRIFLKGSPREVIHRRYGVLARGRCDVIRPLQLNVPRTILLCGWLLGLLCLQAPGQEPKEKGGGGKDARKQGKSPEQLEREKRILDLFSCTSKKMDGDRIELVYAFETKQEDLVDDWKPALHPNNARIRWTRALEGTWTTLEDGIVLGDFGEWLHKAVFLPDIEVEVELQAASQHKAGNVMAPIFYNDKKKRALGSNNGSQVVYLAGGKHAKPAIPKQERAVTSNARFAVGYAFKGTTFEARLRGRKSADTTASPKYAEGFDRGRVGMGWSGSVQYFVFKVTIKGKLDPEWVAKELGEPAPAAGKEKAKAKDKSKPAGANAGAADKGTRAAAAPRR